MTQQALRNLSGVVGTGIEATLPKEGGAIYLVAVVGKGAQEIVEERCSPRPPRPSDLLSLHFGLTRRVLKGFSLLPVKKGFCEVRSAGLRLSNY